ncbi:hypothetical protein [Sphingobium phenoxybenzoativorans]|uniref:hypothetical protein n=1 Tax=Sphingobium phenoxybenzoativorans TaxID=1592790 RepID=UPI0008732A59|nr:hypothetical protein [Sphingobium phenoxybenzoativorans]
MNVTHNYNVIVNKFELSSGDEAFLKALLDPMRDIGINHKSVYLDLERMPISDEAVALVDHLISQMKPWLGAKPRQAGLSKALGTILPCLLEAVDGDANGYAYRPMNAAEFTDQPIGHRPFQRVVKAMVKAGYLSVTPGSCPTKPTTDDPRTSTQFRPSIELWLLCSDLGVSPLDWEPHFGYRPAPARVAKPILLNSSTKARYKGYRREKVESVPMAVPLSCPKVADLADEVNALNAFLSKQDIQPQRLYRGLHRIFSDGDLASPYGWDKGGRLYCRGGGYQNIPHKQNPKKPDEPFRQMITINGQQLVEVDLKGSHLRILYALKGIPLNESDDPYHVPGLDRDIVKSWVTMTLGHNKFHKYWTADIKKKYTENELTEGRVLQEDYPYQQVHNQIMKELTIFSDWPVSKWRWGDFQYIESCILIDAMNELCLEKGIPALPLHDSLLVPSLYAHEAQAALSWAFYKRLNARPGISIK